MVQFLFYLFLLFVYAERENKVGVVDDVGTNC